MNKRSIIVLVFILVFIGGGCFVYLSLGAKNKNSDITVAEDMGKVEEGVEQSEKTVSPAEETKVDNQDSKTEKTESKKDSKDDKKNKDKTEKKTEVSSDKKSEDKTEKPTEQKTEIKTEKKANDTTQQSTEEYTEKRTEAPTQAPTEAPTERKTEAPTEHKTETPTQQRTEAPTEKRTEAPTQAPTEAPRCAHNWVWKTYTETVHHDAVTHEETYLIGDAWDEDVYVTKVKCGVCGAIYENDSDYYARDNCMGNFGSTSVYDHTIHHDAEYGTYTVTDKEAYDEYIEVKDYQYCSKCGETK